MEAIRILVIEDEKLIRENIREILQMHGYEIETAADGAEGILKAGNFDPDIILCDILMPKVNGYKVVEVIRTQLNRHDIPIIFISALSEVADVRKGMELGVDDYLTKPFKIQDLLNVIEVRLNKKKAELNYYTTNKKVAHFSSSAEYSSLRHAIKKITSSERRILIHVARNLTSPEIADSLNLSVRTVENHRANIIRKIKHETNFKLYEFSLKTTQYGLLEK